MTAEAMTKTEIETAAPILAPVASKWDAPVVPAAAAMLSALDAVVTSEGVTVLSAAAAIPADLDTAAAVGVAWSHGGSFSYRKPLREAIESLDANAGMLKEHIRSSKPWGQTVGSVLGVNARTIATKDGVSLSRIRDRVVVLDLLRAGAEDCAHNIELGSDAEAGVPSVKVQDDVHGLVPRYVPTGKISGPCIEAGAFRRCLNLFTVTGEESFKIATFKGLARTGKAGNLRMVDFVSMADAVRALASVGVRTTGQTTKARLVVPTNNKRFHADLAEITDRALAEKIESMGKIQVQEYLKAATEGCRVYLGGASSLPAHTEAARKGATGAAYCTALREAGLGTLADAAEQYGVLGALTSGLTLAEEG